MGWPTPQDYNEAIQCPQFCFADTELKQGNPSLTRFGIPKPISGTFASVYEMKCSDRRWAVRCFLREIADQERRYSAIGRLLSEVKLPCMVGFEFLSKGIQVRGQWVPILKMEWIDGEPIHEYIKRNLDQHAVLRSLSQKWITLITSLRNAGIAHGDLQHGNILVSDGELKLIDYDGMYVPALAGLSSNERGQPNYQHPKRDREYHSELDNFSAWVIFTSISALAVDPRLWERLNAGDECLLFRKGDFLRPMQSKALQMLEQSRSLQLQTLVSNFQSILRQPLAQIPSLDGPIIDLGISTTSALGQRHRPSSQGLPAWLSDHVQPALGQDALTPLETTGSESNSPGAAWLFEHLVDIAVAGETHQPVIKLRNRIALWCSLTLIVALAAALALPWVSYLVVGGVILLAVAACGFITLSGYRVANPPGAGKEIRMRLKAGRTALAQIENEISLSRLERNRLAKPHIPIKRAYDQLPEKMDHEIEGLKMELAAKLESIEDRRREAEKQLAASLQQIDLKAEQLKRTHDKTLKKIAERKDRIQQDKEAALRKLEIRTNSEVDVVKRRQNSLQQEEQVEREEAIQIARSTYVRTAMNLARPGEWKFTGIGSKLQSLLHASGIRSAADVTYDQIIRLNGIGEARARELLAWRDEIERHARSTAPASLSPADSKRIREKYAAEWLSLDRTIGSLRSEVERKRRQILDEYDGLARTLIAEEESARRGYAAQINQIRTESAKERDRLTAVSLVLERSLHAEEECAKQQHTNQLTGVKSKFNQEKERLASNHTVEKSKAVAAQKVLDAKLDELSRSIFQRRLAVCQAERDLGRLRSLTLSDYFVWALWPPPFPTPRTKKIVLIGAIACLAFQGFLALTFRDHTQGTSVRVASTESVLTNPAQAMKIPVRPKQTVPPRPPLEESEVGDVPSDSTNEVSRLRLTVSPASESDSFSGNSAGQRKVLMVGSGESCFVWCPREDPALPLQRETRSEPKTPGFWMLQTEVSQALYESVTGRNPSHFKSPKYPVETVSFDDSWAFAQDLTKQLRHSGELPVGWAVVLPTETEWEYACRAGTTTKYAFGHTLSSSQANFDGRRSGGPNLNRPTAVMSFQPNAWGLYDMHGNVWEWCISANTPQRQAVGRGAVIRGGGWFNFSADCASSTGLSEARGTKQDWIGFRVIAVQIPRGE